MSGRDGYKVEALPVDKVFGIIEKHGYAITR